jgi:hypothetical protein
MLPRGLIRVSICVKSCSDGLDAPFGGCFLAWSTCMTICDISALQEGSPQGSIQATRVKARGAVCGPGGSQHALAQLLFHDIQGVGGGAIK